ncbi:hypothetical protein HIM_04159 [Hirsutella minnesotensis 3608]|uniref:Uncharacterized protein n=1 Tax=Hirsutella minnesotensis 3608 TaxID=1043627 RepID=A0A0F7ZQ09_9HYPO|nr:hypothetical protein HIM_04159 [Hirsutella minnesotensis 3608]
MTDSVNEVKKLLQLVLTDAVYIGRSNLDNLFGKVIAESIIELGLEGNICRASMKQVQKKLTTEVTKNHYLYWEAWIDDDKGDTHFQAYVVDHMERTKSGSQPTMWHIEDLCREIRIFMEDLGPIFLQEVEDHVKHATQEAADDEGIFLLE